MGGRDSDQDLLNHVQPLILLLRDGWEHSKHRLLSLAHPYRLMGTATGVCVYVYVYVYGW